MKKIAGIYDLIMFSNLSLKVKATCLSLLLSIFWAKKITKFF